MIKSENKNSNMQFLGNRRELEEVTWDECVLITGEEQRKTTERNIIKKKSSE